MTDWETKTQRVFCYKECSDGTVRPCEDFARASLPDEDERGTQHDDATIYRRSYGLQDERALNRANCVRFGALTIRTELLTQSVAIRTPTARTYFAFRPSRRCRNDRGAMPGSSLTNEGSSEAMERLEAIPYGD